MSIRYAVQPQKRDLALLDQLFTCKRESQQQRHRGAALPSQLVEMVSQVADSFLQDHNRLQTERSLFKDRNRKVREQERELQSRIRHALQGVRHHRALLTAVGVPLSAFGLTEAGTCPEHLKRLREPVEIAKNILNAHKPVAAAGQNVLRDPTVGELEARLAAIEAGRQAHKTARDGEQAALKQMRQTRTLAQKVLRTVRVYIQTMSIGLSKEEQRMILKEFGFIFVARPILAKAAVKSEDNQVADRRASITEGGDPIFQNNDDADSPGDCKNTDDAGKQIPTQDMDSTRRLRGNRDGLQPAQDDGPRFEDNLLKARHKQKWSSNRQGRFCQPGRPAKRYHRANPKSKAQRQKRHQQRDQRIHKASARDGGCQTNHTIPQGMLPERGQEETQHTIP